MYTGHADLQSFQPPYKDLVEQKFQARCADYDQKGSYHYKVASELVEGAGLQPGWSVLDVACGTGLATFLAASEVGQTGSVLGVDLSSGMVEEARNCQYKLCCCLGYKASQMTKRVSVGKGQIAAVILCQRFFLCGGCRACHAPEQFL